MLIVVDSTVILGCLLYINNFYTWDTWGKSWCFDPLKKVHSVKKKCTVRKEKMENNRNNNSVLALSCASSHEKMPGKDENTGITNFKLPPQGFEPQTHA